MPDRDVSLIEGPLLCGGCGCEIIPRTAPVGTTKVVHVTIKGNILMCDECWALAATPDNLNSEEH